MAKFLTDHRYVERLRGRRRAIQPHAADGVHASLESVAASASLAAAEDWLAQIVLLNGVPASHLIANPNLLPQDAIRFFYIDQNWINALVDGALSVGIQSTTDVAVTSALHPDLHREAKARAPMIRSRLLGVADESAPPPEQIWTGFLLRSAVVYAYPGLEVTAFANKTSISGTDDGDGKPDYAGTDPLTLLRMDRLAPDVLIAIFNGAAALVQINEPPEGLAFGVQDLNGSDVFQLRGLGETWTDNVVHWQAGEQIPKATAAIPYRDQSQRTVDVSSLFTTLPGQLAAQQAHQASNPFGPADLALQMISLPEQKKFYHRD